MFRKQISFNPHDTSVSVDPESGRTVVKLGVAQRCELILQTLVRRSNKGAETSDLLAAIQKKNACYTNNDVDSAVRRLIALNLIRKTGGYGQPIGEGQQPVRYYAGKGVMRAFRTLRLGEAVEKLAE